MNSQLIFLNVFYRSVVVRRDKTGI